MNSLAFYMFPGLLKDAATNLRDWGRSERRRGCWKFRFSGTLHRVDS